MHDSSLVAELLDRIAAAARENAAQRVVAVEVSLGAQDSIGADHLREHFIAAAPGTIAEGAELLIKIDEDPLSAGLILRSLELER